MSRLQGSIFTPHLAERFQPAIESLTSAGLDSLTWASGDPSQSGGTVEHKTFSYLRIRVLPDELHIEPVGVRQSDDTVTHSRTGNHAGWERVYPLPVHEVPDTQTWRAGGAQETRSRHLQHIKVRRGESPVAVWEE
jgi:hypothetical protein